MAEKKYTLTDLELNPGWIYEGVVTTGGPDGPHAAPFGFSLGDDGLLRLSIFKTATSLARILEQGVFGLNISDDPLWFHWALNLPQQLEFIDGSVCNTPLLAGVEMAVEAELVRADGQGWRRELSAAARAVHVRRLVRPWNRARCLVMESLVLSTRQGIIPPAEFAGALRENHRVICKVAPGSPYARASAGILAKAGVG